MLCPSLTDNEIKSNGKLIQYGALNNTAYLWYLVYSFSFVTVLIFFLWLCVYCAVANLTESP